MHKSRLGCLIIDCHEPDDMMAAARFWAGTLGYEVDEQDDEGKYVSLKGPANEPYVAIQRVDHESRIHIDIETDDKEAEAARLEKLGAKRIAAIKGWIVMQAPSGHRFCLVGPNRADFAEKAKGWG
ncbi:MAG: VOC family protein [Alphaproteobacteria bacterium]